MERMFLLPGNLIFTLQFSDKKGRITMRARIMMIFVASIKIEMKPSQVVIVAMWRNAALRQQSGIIVFQL